MKIVMGLLLFLLIVLQTIFALYNFSLFSPAQPSIKVGLIYSKTGFRAVREQATLEATLMAIQEINQAGGLLGRTLVPIIKDAKSSWKITQDLLDDLIVKEKVDVIFGCWNQGNESLVKDQLDKYNHLLITPYQYTGFIHSPNIVYVGTSASQQVVPTVYYFFKEAGPRFFLVGSNAPFSRIINTMVKDQVKAIGGLVVGERYADSEGQSNQEILQTIMTEAKPDVIISSITGKNAVLFLKEARMAGIDPHTRPIISFHLSELNLQEADIDYLEGNYVTWNYFQSIETELNNQFVSHFKNFSHLNFIDNTAESAYIGVYLWAQAVEEVKTTHLPALKYALADLHLKAPEGYITMNMDGRNAWKYVRIGKIRSDRQFDIVWESSQPFRPLSLQGYRSRLEWVEMIEKIFQQVNVQFSFLSEEERN